MAVSPGKMWNKPGAANASGNPPQLKVAVVAGAGANTNIAIAGLVKGQDALLSVLEVPASAALVDRTATTSITSDGNIQCTASTAGNQLLVVYYDNKN
jgi:hypothetical protein